MELLFNPVILAVLVMTALCLLKVNILIAIIISTLVGGLVAGIPISEIMDTFIGGMGGNSNTALAYILLGALAYAIQDSGLAGKFGNIIEKSFGRNAKLLICFIAFISIFSQNLIPVHIAFIPIIIPPLLKTFNKLKIDRRAVACALTFGLKAPYISLPVGFGLIFHGIVADSMTANGLPFEKSQVWTTLTIPALGMVLGLFIAIFFTYRKPREYQDIDIAASNDQEGNQSTQGFTIKHFGALVGAIAAFVIQLLTDSLPLGALVGLLLMLAFGTIKFNAFDKTINKGIEMMGFIAFVMLVAAGFGAVIRATGGVEALVEAGSAAMGGSKLVAAIALLLIGLVITMGIGTSFGTIPIVATIYVPLCMKLGFSPAATACLIGVAAALGDAGSPASDSTLGPTSGLNADGQHDHIRDTCIPTFLHFNIPLIIFGVIASMIL